MSKPSKNKKDKVPKITEEEYMAYLSTLKDAPMQTANNVSNLPAEQAVVDE